MTMIAQFSSRKNNCNKGYSCQSSCISRLKDCRNPLDGQGKNYAEWLRKNSSSRNSVKSIIDSEERSLRFNPIESAVVFNQDGSIILRKDSSGDVSKLSTGLSFTDEEVAKMEGAILTHNHPLGLSKPEGSIGYEENGLSASDWLFAANSKLAEMRAVSPGYSYSIKMPESGWDADYAESVISPALSRIDAQVRQQFEGLAVEAFKNGGIQAYTNMLEQINANHNHEVSARLSSELGIEYVRTRLDD